MSQEVLEAQQWLNATYGNNPYYIHVEETGLPGTATSFALVSALQIELNLGTITGIFGNMTYAACQSAPLNENDTGNRVMILQYGFYCKGYDPIGSSGVLGTFGSETTSALQQIQADAGLSSIQSSDSAEGLQMMAVVGVDEYKFVSHGDLRIRPFQQYLNTTYLDYLNNRLIDDPVGLCPCDGIYGRNTCRAILFALQSEMNIPLLEATGNFGPTTKRCLPDIPYNQQQFDNYGNVYSSTQITNFTRIAQFTVYCIGHNRFMINPQTSGSRYDPGRFDGIIDLSTMFAFNTFRIDYRLPQPVTMITIYDWMSLLLSTGYPDRAVTAIDCATRITEQFANEIATDGRFTYIGRYLTGDLVIDNKRVAKNLLRPEMKAIFQAGLKLFLIFQDPRQFFTENEEEEDIRNYFTYHRGLKDAEKAFIVAKTLDVPDNEVIYFAVDFDFMEDEIALKVIPYFEGISVFAQSEGNTFRIGIYGSRNTCILVGQAGYSESSFVAGMSTGFSGNLGFPLPEDWAFDQIQGVEDDPYLSFPFDRNVASGRYKGFSQFKAGNNSSGGSTEWDLISSNGYALVHTNGLQALPVYWGKIKKGLGDYETKFPMYDSIPINAFFSYRRRNNTNRPWSDYINDNIRYVYFRDVGGKINAGYVDFTGYSFDWLSAPHAHQIDDFWYCEIERNATTGASVLIRNHPNTANPVQVVFRLTKSARYRNTSGVVLGVLPALTYLRFTSSNVTGASFPHYLNVEEKMLPDSLNWAWLDNTNNNSGYVDLCIEDGVLPDDRNWITDYV